MARHVRFVPDGSKPTRAIRRGFYERPPAFGGSLAPGEADAEARQPHTHARYCQGYCAGMPANLEAHTTFQAANTFQGLLWKLMGVAAAACMRQWPLTKTPGLAGEALPALCCGPAQLPRAAAGGGQRHSRCRH